MIKTGKAGKGAYGVVYTGEFIGKEGKEVAVKRNIVNNDYTFSGSLKELDLLNKLRGHPFIVRLLSVNFGNPFNTPNSPIKMHHGKDHELKEDYVYFVFEKAEKDLNHLIHDKTLHVSYLKYAMVQMLLGLEYIHKKKIIHRDIKPDNLLWFVEDNMAAIRFCDFGLSKIHTNQQPNTPRAVTCWYRAPEICCRMKNYSYVSDIWSLGCIFFEMFSKKALSQGCEDDDRKILMSIISQIGINHSDIDYFKNNTYKHNTMNETINSLESVAAPKTIEQLAGLSPEDIEQFNSFPETGAKWSDFIDLVQKMLTVDPRKRITATEALAHPFFRPYYEMKDWSRKYYPIVDDPVPTIKIISCKERQWACKTAAEIFNNRDHMGWYSHRCIFQAIDIFDRYLVYLDNKFQRDGTSYNLESQYQGRFMSRFDAELRFTVCLYLTIKYYCTLVLPIKFTSLVSDRFKSPKAMLQAEEFEKKLIKILRYKIYRETVYECADRIPEILDEFMIRDMLSKYISLTDCEISLEDLYYNIRGLKKPQRTPSIKLNPVAMGLTKA